jgi:adenylate kinase family enzyme
VFLFLLYALKMSKLIILRGNSGSGKSTVAKALFEQVTKPAVLIEQDYYRFIFKPAGGTLNSKTIHKMIKANVLAALKDNYDVILEGIFNVKSWKVIFDEIFEIHPKDNFIFYFDISFEETLRRHRTKPNKNEWSEEDMKSWYNEKDFLNYDFEHTIEEKLSKDETIKIINGITKV